MKAAIYCRMSLEDDLDNNETHEKVKKIKIFKGTLKTEPAQCKAYIKANGWELSGIYIEEKSVNELNQPELQRLFQDIKDRKINAVITSRFEHMFRDVRNFLEITNFFQEHNCTFICLDTKIDTATPIGRVFAAIRAALVQFEREAIADRMKFLAKKEL